MKDEDERQAAAGGRGALRRINLLIPLLIFASITALTGCATTNAAKETPKENKTETVIELFPTKIIGHRGEKPTSEIIDAIETYNEGVNAYKNRDYALAATKFRLVIKHFPGTPMANRSHFTLAATLVEMNGFAEAKGLLETYLALHAKTDDDKISSMYLLMDCYEKLRAWDDEIKIGKMLEKNYPNLDASLQIELFARLGYANLNRGETLKAELSLNNATNIYLRAKGKNEYVAAYFVAAAYFYKGLLGEKKFAAMKLDNANYDLAFKSLDDKSNELLRAQQDFGMCILQGVPEWAAAAGFETGRLYESFYLEIVSQKIPLFAQKDEESKSIYQCMLKEFVFGVLRNAMRVYGEVVKLGERTETKNVWIDKTKERLDNLEIFYKSELDACAPFKPHYDKPLKEFIEKVKKAKQQTPQ